MRKNQKFGLKGSIYKGILIVNVINIDSRRVASTALHIDSFVQSTSFSHSPFSNLETLNSKIKDLLYILQVATNFASNTYSEDVLHSRPKSSGLSIRPVSPQIPPLHRPPFSIGSNDRDILEPVGPQGGMLFGPDHPGFEDPSYLPP